MCSRLQWGVLEMMVSFFDSVPFFFLWKDFSCSFLGPPGLLFVLSEGVLLSRVFRVFIFPFSLAFLDPFSFLVAFPFFPSRMCSS